MSIPMLFWKNWYHLAHDDNAVVSTIIARQFQRDLALKRFVIQDKLVCVCSVSVDVFSRFMFCSFWSPSDETLSVH